MKKVVLMILVAMANATAMDTIEMPSTPIAVLTLNELGKQEEFKVPEVPKKHKCDQCDKAFAQSSDVTRHKRTHTGEKPYVCDWDGCDAAFAYSSNLSRHKRKHVKKRREEVAGEIPSTPMAIDILEGLSVKRRQFEEIGE